MKNILMNIRLLAVMLGILGLGLGVNSCRDSQLIDETEFNLFYPGVTDIGPSMTIPDGIKVTYIGAQPSDFAITGIKFGNENFQNDEDEDLNATPPEDEELRSIVEGLLGPQFCGENFQNIVNNALAGMDTKTQNAFKNAAIEENKQPILSNTKSSEDERRKETINIQTEKSDMEVEQEEKFEASSAVEENQSKNTEEKIIPILSILASKKDDEIIDNKNLNEAPVKNTKNIDPTEENLDKTVMKDIEIKKQDNVSITSEKTTNEEIITDTQRVTIEDMISDEAPDAPIEKTLEQLLESMTPLREDITEEQIETTDIDTEINYDESDNETSYISDTNDLNNSEETDATLEQLAAEFAETEDKISTNTKPENHSKIGKLKNILPFKKAKKEDSGIMGDLFGWAGIAANDEDFSIPGFFTNAASKK